MMIFIVNMFDFVLKMLDYVLKMFDFVLNLLDCCSSSRHGRRKHGPSCHSASTPSDPPSCRGELRGGKLQSLQVTNRIINAILLLNFVVKMQR